MGSYTIWFTGSIQVFFPSFHSVLFLVLCFYAATALSSENELPIPEDFSSAESESPFYFEHEGKIYEFSSFQAALGKMKSLKPSGEYLEVSGDGEFQNGNRVYEIVYPDVEPVPVDLPTLYKATDFNLCSDENFKGWCSSYSVALDKWMSHDRWLHDAIANYRDFGALCTGEYIGKLYDFVHVGWGGVQAAHNPYGGEVFYRVEKEVHEAEGEFVLIEDPWCSDDEPRTMKNFEIEMYKIVPYECPESYIRKGESTAFYCTNSARFKIYAPHEQSCEPLAGNPCGIASRKKIQTEIDLQIGPISIARTYRNNLLTTNENDRTKIGNDWWLSVDRKLHVSYGKSFYLDSRANFRPMTATDYTFSTLVVENDEPLVIKRDGPNRVLSREGGKEIYNFNRLIEVSEGGRRAIIDRTFSKINQIITESDIYNFHYDEESRLSSIESSQDPSISVHYEYDSSGRLVGVLLPGDELREYVYEDSRFSDHLTGILVNGVRISEYKYDASGKVHKTENFVTGEYLEFSDIQESFLADTDGDHSTRVSDRSGNTAQYEFQFINGQWKLVENSGECSTCPDSLPVQIKYNEKGQKLEEIYRNGRRDLYERDNYGFVTQHEIHDGNGQVDSRFYVWDHETGKLIQETKGDVDTRYSYDDSGNRIEIIRTDTQTGSARVTRQRFDGMNRLLEIDGPRTDVSDITTYTYDAQGNISTIINALGHVTHYTDYDAQGNPLRIVDANGIVTELEYDLRQRLVSRTVAAGTADAATTSFTYDPVGQLIETTLPNGASIHYDYDAAHRLVAIDDNLGNRIDYTLDAMGNRVFETVSGPGGTVFRDTSREYNTLNRLVASIGGEGQRTTYTYDAEGNRTSVTDAAYNTTNQRYDALDRLFETVDALGGVTQYHYDPSDNLTRVVDPRGVTTDYTYNGFNELIETASPDAGTTTYTYDKAGNRISQTDARGITVNYQYDALNRLTFIDYPEPTDGSPSQDIAYTYDDGPNGIGRLSRIEDETGSIEYYYGPRGSLLSKVSIVNGIELAVDYSVDTADNLTGVHYPSGATVSYSRDAAGRVTAINLTGDDGYPVTLADNIDYAPFGPVTGMHYGNGISETRRFDRDGRITRLSSSALDYSYTWDATNNITGITDNLDSTKTQNFDYDALYRLTHATGSYGNLDWQHDAVGNRTQQVNDSGTTYYDYAYTANRLLTTDGPSGSTHYQYDANGNTLTDGNNSYHYDARNRLVEADSAYTYKHNALGQRVSKPRFQAGLICDANNDGVIDQQDLAALHDMIKGRIAKNPLADCNQDGFVDRFDNAAIAQLIGESKNRGKKNRETTQASATSNSGTIIGQILFVYDEAGHLLGEYDEAGAIIREYVWHSDRPVAMLDANGDVHYIHSDHLNTPKVVTDSNQQVVWKGDYTPFGEVDETIATIEFNLRFPGQYEDGETGLNYNYFRSYDASTGRYTQSDPIGLYGGLNVYNYVSSSPVRAADPYGLFCIPLFKETTPWKETWRGKPSYDLTSVAFSDVGGITGGCLWVKSVPVLEERKYRTRDLCFECQDSDDECGGRECGWFVKYGDWRRERQDRNETERSTSTATRLFTGNDIEAGDFWFCSNPWTGQLAKGRM